MKRRRIRAEDLAKDQLVKGMRDNGWHLPGALDRCEFTKQFLLQVYRGEYWLPRTDEVRIKVCSTAPVKEVIFHEIIRILKITRPGMEWPVTLRMPTKQYMLDCLAVLDYNHQFFAKHLSVNSYYQAPLSNYPEIF